LGELTKRRKLLLIQSLAMDVMMEYGLLADGWRFDLNRWKTGGGQCLHPPIKKIEVSYIYVESNPIEVGYDVVLHEIAHALAGCEAAHGEVWQEWCLKLGAIPYPYCSDEAIERVPAKYMAGCPTCLRRYVMHRRPSKKMYWCPECGPEMGLLFWE
jgi:SprT protein